MERSFSRGVKFCWLMERWHSRKERHKANVSTEPHSFIIWLTEMLSQIGDFISFSNRDCFTFWFIRCYFHVTKNEDWIIPYWWIICNICWFSEFRICSNHRQEFISGWKIITTSQWGGGYQQLHWNFDYLWVTINRDTNYKCKKNKSLPKRNLI